MNELKEKLYKKLIAYKKYTSREHYTVIYNHDNYLHFLKQVSFEPPLMLIFDIDLFNLSFEEYMLRSDISTDLETVLYETIYICTNKLINKNLNNI